MLSRTDVEPYQLCLSSAPLSQALRQFILSLLPVSLLFCGSLVLFGGPAAAWAQPADSVRSAFPSLTSSQKASFERGVQAIKAGNYRQAQAHLAPLATTAPLAQHPTYGAPVAWLGRAFLEQGNTRQARRTWFGGIQRAERTDRTAVDVANALLQSVPPDAIGSNSRTVTYAFEHIVDALGDSIAPAEAPPLRRHAAQLALIAPDSIARPLTAFARNRVSSSALTIGPAVPRWLRSQDPVLATETNERVREHLTRVRTAEQKYAWDGRPSGLDDRGETYVRLGPPGRTVSVEYESSERVSIPSTQGFETVTSKQIRWAIQEETGASPSTLIKENEVWDYPDLGPSVQFFFVQRIGKDGNPYLEGRLRNLLPHALRTPPQRPQPPPETGEGRIPDGAFGIRDVKVWKAYYPVYRSIYEQLQFVDDRYGRRYSDLRTLDFTSPQSPPPTQEMRVTMARNKNQNLTIRREREQQAPTQRTTVLSAPPSAPVAVRTARFLEEDGTTQLDAYWSGNTDEWTPSSQETASMLRRGQDLSGNYLLRTTGLPQPPSLDSSASRQRVDTLSTSGLKSRNRLATRSLRVPIRSDQSRLSLEWIQNAIRPDGRVGRIVHVTQRTVESGVPLSANSSALEMSDLRLLAVPDEGPPLPKTPAEARRRVIPFERISATRRLALNFEAYHLLFGADDRTRYTVEYSTQYEREAQGLTGLFGDTDTEKTTTASTYQGSRRRTNEYILFRLSDVSDLDEPTPVTVSVRVTDEVSGQSVERSISFTLVPPGASSASVPSGANASSK